MPGAAPSNHPEPTKAKPAPEPPRRRPLQLALILVAAFMVVLDFSIVNVALPSIERDCTCPPSSPVDRDGIRHLVRRPPYPRRPGR